MTSTRTSSLPPAPAAEAKSTASTALELAIELEAVRHERDHGNRPATPHAPFWRDVQLITEALRAERERALEEAARVALHEWESPQDGYDEAFANVLAAIASLKASR
jgi:hypothetical protein